MYVRKSNPASVAHNAFSLGTRVRRGEQSLDEAESLFASDMAMALRRVIDSLERSVERNAIHPSCAERAAQKLPRAAHGAKSHRHTALITT